MKVIHSTLPDALKEIEALMAAELDTPEGERRASLQGLDQV